MPVDIESSVRGGSLDDVKKNGGFQEIFYRVKESIRELTQMGLSNPAELEYLFLQTLRSVEQMRVEAERNIHKLERQIEWQRAIQASASQFQAILLGSVQSRVQAGKASAQIKASFAVEEQPNPQSDTEVIKTICICGCRDEKDAKDCKCKCHTIGHCEKEDCAVCPSIRISGKPSSAIILKKSRKRNL